MKYADALLDHADAVYVQANEGLDLMRDMAAFFKRRMQIEEEYSKNMSKLARGILDAKQESKRKSGSSGKGSLYDAWIELVAEVEEIGNLHKSLTNQINKLLLEPFQAYIKDNDVTKKALITEGTKYQAELQDAFSTLKKAKDTHDKALKDLETAEEKTTTAVPSKTISLSRLSMSPSAPADLANKALQKAQVAREKAKASEAQVDQCKSICDDRQELFYKRWMPSLLDRFQKFEYNRVRFVKDTLTVSQQMEARLPSRVKAACDRVFKALDEVDPDNDCDAFIAEHTGADHYGRASVSSLTNSTKTSRVMKRPLAPAHASWRSRFLVLMAPARLLYLFESETSQKPSEVYQLDGCRVRPVHDSRFDRPNVLMLTLASEQGGLRTYFEVESETEMFAWLQLLTTCSLPVPMNDLTVHHRKILSLSLTVVEARGLLPVDPIRRTANPYCLISLDKTLEATSSVCMNSVNPLWNERIVLDDIDPFQVLTVKVSSQPSFPATRTVDIGEIDIPVATLERRSLDDWLTLVPVSSSAPSTQEKRDGFALISAVTSASGALLNSAINTASNIMINKDDEAAANEVMSIRVKSELKTEVILPLVDYKLFLQAMLKEDQVAVRALLDLLSADRDVVARHVVRVWIASNAAISNLTKLNCLEIQSTDDSAIIFRANSVATKTMDQYMKQISGEYLRTALSAVTKAVFSSKQSCEVDLSRLEEGEDVKRNTKRLLGFVRSYLDAIYASIDSIPSELRTLFNTIQDQVMHKFPNDRKIRYTAVSGFIFLRLICPAIMSPAVHGLVSDTADVRTTRNLTLIAKILQNLANIVGENGKEQAFMGEINTFVAENLDDMRQFIRNVATVSSPTTMTPTTTTIGGQVELARELEAVRNTFEMLTSKIQSHPTLSLSPSIAEVLGEVARLGEKCKTLGARGRIAVPGLGVDVTWTQSPVSPRSHTAGGMMSPLMRPSLVSSMSEYPRASIDYSRASDLDLDDGSDMAI